MYTKGNKTDSRKQQFPFSLIIHTGVKQLIHQSELRTYTMVVPFKEKSSFRFVVLSKILNGME
jgi:hypothetical protein